MKTIRICGVGSVLLGDDAVGPYVARWIAAHYIFNEPGETGARVEVEDLGTPGLDLIAYLSGIDVLILIDSAANHLPPGSVTIYDREALIRHRPAVRLDPHAPCITESIFIAELAGDGPKEVCLIGVTPEQTEVGAGLSQCVRNAIPLVAEKALQQVVLHGGSFHEREVPDESTIWWDREELVGKL